MSEQRTTVDPMFGFRRLDPVPAKAELDDFYESRYYELLNSGSRAPDIARLAAGGDEASREREWMHRTLYRDLADAFAGVAPGKRVLDVGCGTGEFVGYLAGRGYDAHGIEPSAAAVASACDRGLSVRAEPLEECAAAVVAGQVEPYDMVTMLHVLEHVPDPRAMLCAVREVLGATGGVGVIVPNDFSALQRAAQAVNGETDWWVAVPDHINYFDAASLTLLLEDTGFSVVERTSTFPMEFFILSGLDYVKDPSLGPRCHERRRQIELTMTVEDRRNLSRRLAGAGMGRDIILMARAADR